MKKIAATVGAVAGVLCVTVASVNAGVYSETKSAQAMFAGVSAAELPAQATSLRTHNTVGQQTDAAIDAMKAAIASNSATAVGLTSILSEVPGTVPEAVTSVAVQAIPKKRLGTTLPSVVYPSIFVLVQV